MNDIEILREMFHPAALVALRPGQGKPAVELTDAKADTTVEIKGLPRESVVIRAEDFEVPPTVFSSTNGQRKRADFVIVANEDAKRWIIYIETQAGNYKTAAHIIAQLKGRSASSVTASASGSRSGNLKNFLMAMSPGL